MPSEDTRQAAESAHFVPDNIDAKTKTLVQPWKAYLGHLSKGETKAEWVDKDGTGKGLLRMHQEKEGSSS